MGTRASGRRIALEPAGRIFLPLFFIGTLLGWAAGGVGLIFTALGLAVLLLALFGALASTRGLELRVLATPAHAVGDAFLFPLEIRSRRRRGHARDLYISCEDRQGAPAGSQRDNSRLGRARPSRARPIGGLAQLAAGERQVAECGHRHMRRGRQGQLRLVLHSSHPFGLVRVERSYQLEADFLAWPRLGRLRSPRRFDSRRPQQAARLQLSRREEEEFYQLRPWREGLSLRRVHWKLSARRGRPILQEFAGEVDTSVHLGLLLSACGRPGSARAERHSFESSVCLAATLVEHHLGRGATVCLSLHGADGTREILTGLRGRRGLVSALDALALVQPTLLDRVQLEQSLERSLVMSPEESLIYSGGGHRGPAATRGADEARAIDVDDTDIDDLFLRHGAGTSESPAAVSAP